MSYIYGMWTCKDGREVLFNRSYQPILERMPGQAARKANPDEWVNDIVVTDIYWVDSSRMHPNMQRRVRIKLSHIKELFQAGKPIPKNYVYFSRGRRANESS